MSQAKDKSAHATCPTCDFGPFTRNHYFTGKLLVERDFTDEQRYYVDKLRHHQQRLHGWGVVCGLKVKPHENPACRDRFVCIEPGTAIDCSGHEIVVREEECLDLTQLDAIKALKNEQNDPDGPRSHTLQVCLRYRECPTEEIPVLYDECGCDETKCAPNRILESYDLDLVVDPSLESFVPHAPRFAWNHTIALAHSVRAVLHEAGHRLYVIAGAGPSTVYAVSTENQAIVGSRELLAKATDIAISNDGKFLYIAAENVSDPAASPRQVVVLETANFETATLNRIDVPGSENSDARLAVAPHPDARLFALIAATGKVLRWETDINTTTTPAAPAETTLSPNLRDLLVSDDAGMLFTADPANHKILVVNNGATLTAGTAIANLPANADPFALAVIRSTGPEVLAVADHSNKQLHVVATDASSIKSVNLDHNPIALVASPGGRWVYVLERDGANPDTYLQPVDVSRLQQGLPTPVGAPFKTGNHAQHIMLTESGKRLYVPYLDDLEIANAGGVAIIEVSERDCCDIFARHLEGCLSCDEANCVVLATIENYHFGDRFEDQTDPPVDPIADDANNIARLDNRKGRRLLPSTQMLAEMLECICESGIGGGGGTQGPPGPKGDKGDKGEKGDKGDKGDPGSGPDPNLTHICGISWPHDGTHKRASFIDGLLIAFDKPVRNVDIHHYSYMVLLGHQEGLANANLTCWCEIRAKLIQGVNLRVPCDPSSGFELAGTADVKVNGAIFIPDSSAVQPMDYRVILKGDFIRDENGHGVDANHLPPWLPLRRTGDGVEGGTFESWFTVD